MSAKEQRRSLQRTEVVSVRLSEEEMRAAVLVGRATSRTVSGLMGYALRLYIEKNYPAALQPGAKVSMRLEEAPIDRDGSLS